MRDLICSPAMTLSPKVLRHCDVLGVPPRRIAALLLASRSPLRLIHGVIAPAGVRHHVSECDGGCIVDQLVHMSGE
jgi:hypothetical protein